MELLIEMGVPTAITGLLVWWLKRSIDKRDREKEAQISNIEQLMQILMLHGRATLVLSEATAKAVQRIPDANCNGDMKAALAQVETIRKEEEEFLIKNSVKHVFDK